MKYGYDLLLVPLEIWFRWVYKCNGAFACYQEVCDSNLVPLLGAKRFCFSMMMYCSKPTSSRASHNSLRCLFWRISNGLSKARRDDTIEQSNRRTYRQTKTEWVSMQEVGQWWRPIATQMSSIQNQLTIALHGQSFMWFGECIGSVKNTTN